MQENSYERIYFGACCIRLAPIRFANVEWCARVDKHHCSLIPVDVILTMMMSNYAKKVTCARDCCLRGSVRIAHLISAIAYGMVRAWENISHAARCRLLQLSLTCLCSPLTSSTQLNFRQNSQLGNFPFHQSSRHRCTRFLF